MFVILLVLSLSGFGVAYNQELKQKICILEELKNALDYIESMIRYQNNTIPESFYKYGYLGNTTTHRFLREVVEEIKSKSNCDFFEAFRDKFLDYAENNYLDKKIISEILDFMSGNPSDKKYRLQLLSQVEINIVNELEQEKKVYKNKGPVVLKISALMSIMLAIVLI